MRAFALEQRLNCFIKNPFSFSAGENAISNLTRGQTDLHSVFCRVNSFAQA